MFNPSRDKKRNASKFPGLYRGTVVDNKDPLGAGRIRVRVLAIYDGVRDEHLPWSQYADPFMGGGDDVGGLFVPDVGARVWVFFENADFMTPVYFAGAPAKPHFPSEKSNGEYPFNRVLKTKAGHVIEIDDSPGEERIKITHKSGTYDLIDKDGNVVQNIVGNLTQTVDGDVSQNVGGSLTSVVSGDTQLTTSNLTVNAGNSVFNSNMLVNGTLGVTGIITAGDAITAAGIITGSEISNGVITLTAHTHLYNDVGASSNPQQTENAIPPPPP